MLKPFWRRAGGKRGPLSCSAANLGCGKSPPVSRRDPPHHTVFAADPSLPARDHSVSEALVALGRNFLLLLSLVNLWGSSCLLPSRSWAVSVLHPVTVADFLLLQ